MAEYYFAASEIDKQPAPRPCGPGAGKRLLGRRVECVDDVRRDAATRRHVVPVSTSPFADCCALLAVDGASATSRAGPPTAPTADATPGGHPLLQIAAEFCGILGRKVNLIGHTVEPEFDRVVGGARTVEIINQGDGDFFRH